MENKKGVEIAITTVLLIILGVAVATILIVILNSQTDIFTNFIDSFRGKSNVDEVIVICNSLASTQSYYEYCCEKKEVRIEKGKETLRQTCGELREQDFALGRIDILDCSKVVCR